MNYCTVQEAWGQENYISNQYKNFNNNNNKKTIEKFSNNKNKKVNNVKNQKRLEKFTNNHKSNCNNFSTHLKTCRTCQNKMREQFRPKILENFEDIIQTNRDIIVLILIGMCVLIFFNLLSNISK